MLRHTMSQNINDISTFYLFIIFYVVVIIVILNISQFIILRNLFEEVRRAMHTDTDTHT